MYSYLISYHYLKGEPDRAIAYGERCLAIGEAAGDVALQALARGYMGYSHHAQGHYAEAEAVLRRNVESPGEGSVAAAGPKGHVLYVSSAGWLGFALADRGQFEAALRYAEMAQRAGEASPNPYAQAIAWTMSGLVHLRRGHLEPAVSFLEGSLTACREKHLTVWRPIPSSLLGLAYALGGSGTLPHRLLTGAINNRTATSRQNQSQNGTIYQKCSKLGIAVCKHLCLKIFCLPIDLFWFLCFTLYHNKKQSFESNY